MGAIRSTKISGNFGPKLNGSVRSNRNSFEKTGPPFEAVLFSRSDRSEILVEWIAPNAFAKYEGKNKEYYGIFRSGLLRGFSEHTQVYLDFSCFRVRCGGEHFYDRYLLVVVSSDNCSIQCAGLVW